MTLISVPQFQALGALLAGVTGPGMAGSVINSLTDAGRAMLAPVPSVDPETVRIVWAKFEPGATKTPAFFFRPSGWKKKGEQGKFGILVPRDVNLDALLLSMRIFGGLPAAKTEAPDGLDVLWPVSHGKTMAISAAVFFGVAGKMGEYFCAKSRQHLTSGPLAELMGRSPAAKLRKAAFRRRPAVNRARSAVPRARASSRAAEVLSRKINMLSLDTTSRERFSDYRLRSIGDVLRLTEGEFKSQVGRIAFSRFKEGNDLSALSRECGQTLHFGMTAAEMGNWERLRDRPPARGRSTLAEVLSWNINWFSLCTTSRDRCGDYRLRCIGDVLKLKEGDIESKLGRFALGEFKRGLSAISEECGHTLHFGMTAAEMRG